MIVTSCLRSRVVTTVAPFRRTSFRRGEAATDDRRVPVPGVARPGTQEAPFARSRAVRVPCGPIRFVMPGSDELWCQARSKIAGSMAYDQTSRSCPWHPVGGASVSLPPSRGDQVAGGALSSPRPSGLQARTPQPRWSRRHSAH